MTTYTELRAQERATAGLPRDSDFAGRGLAAIGDPDGLLGCVRSGNHLAGVKHRPLRYAVPGIFPEGLTVLAGAPKRGKSWLALDCALAVAAGGRALGGIECVPGRSLLLALEDSERRLQARTRHLLGRDPIPERFHYATELPEPGRLLDLLRAFLRQHLDTRLIVLDTLARVRPPAPRGVNLYEHDYRIAAALKGVADSAGIGIVAVTHTAQRIADDFVEQVSGTSGLTGAADTIVVLDRARGQDDGKLKVTGRDVDEREYAMRMVGGAWQILDRPPVDPALADRSTSILELARTCPDGIRAGDIVGAMGIGAMAMDEHQARTYLSRLATSGRLDQRGRGLYALPTSTPVASVASVAFLPAHKINATDATHATGGYVREDDPA